MSATDWQATAEELLKRIEKMQQSDQFSRETIVISIASALDNTWERALVAENLTRIEGAVAGLTRCISNEEDRFRRAIEDAAEDIVRRLRRSFRESQRTPKPKKGTR